MGRHELDDELRGVGGWLAREPVRLYVYSVLLALIALLVVRGSVSGYEAPFWTALAAAVLGVPATEAARSRVSPVAPGNRERRRQP